jgi:predicted anti-sigma-YlaC factor YlaD
MRKNKQAEFPDVYDATCEAHLVSLNDLSAYIDKELPAWKRHLIRQHLKKCAPCANQVQRLQYTDDFLHQGDEIEVPENFLNSVMARVSEATEYQRQPDSAWSYVTRLIGSSLGRLRHSLMVADRLRYSIRTRSPVYIFVLTFAVFTMVGATLYQSSSDRFHQSMHVLKKAQKLGGEKLISFEVIQHEPPKRLLTTYLNQSSTASNQQDSR